MPSREWYIWPRKNHLPLLDSSTRRIETLHGCICLSSPFLAHKGRGLTLRMKARLLQANRPSRPRPVPPHTHRVRQSNDEAGCQRNLLQVRLDSDVETSPYDFLNLLPAYLISPCLIPSFQLYRNFCISCRKQKFIDQRTGTTMTSFKDILLAWFCMHSPEFRFGSNQHKNQETKKKGGCLEMSDGKGVNNIWHNMYIYMYAFSR